MNMKYKNMKEKKKSININIYNIYDGDSFLGLYLGRGMVQSEL